MKKVLASVVLAGAALISVFAGVPSGYYSRIDGQKKAELKSAVKACINSGKKTLSYSSLFEYYERTDVMPGTQDQVFDYYNTQVFHYTGKGTAPSGMNKEHCCPQSWFKSTGGCYSDLFNVMPSESNANSSKSNYPVGVVNPNKVTYSNPHMKVGPSATNEYTGSVFEPCDEFKGDFARIYLYVATCYDQAAWGEKSSAIDEVCAFTKEAYPTIRPAFINLLLQWHRQDPVDEWEIGRNERVYKEQNNRNPFIDYPQLAEYIWGDSTAYAFDLANARINGYGAYSGGGGGTPVDTTIITPDTTVIVPPVPDGTVIFMETFADADEGNNRSSSGSSTTWSGNENFPTVKTIYQAGGAVRVGSSKNQGSLTSCTIDYAGGSCAVKVMVKGWDGIEGDLKVGLTGCSDQSKSYTAEMSDAFEEVAFLFEDVAANPKLTLTTTKGRCFIDNVEVQAVSTSGIEDLEVATESDACLFDLSGRSLRQVQKGLNVRNGKVILVR